MSKGQTTKEGIKHDTNKLPMELISPFAKDGLAGVLRHGCKKYEARNWELGMKYSRIIGAIERHLNEIKKGNDIDPESLLLHIDHLQCEAMFLSHFQHLGKDELDDRPHYEGLDT